MVAFNVCIVAATADTSPATIGTVIATVPIVLALAGPLLEGRRPAPAIIVSACVVAAGAGLASGFGGGSARGLLLSLGALAGEVCFSLLAVPLLPRLGPLRVSAYSAALAAPMLLAAGLVTDGTAALRVPTAAELAGFAYLSAVVTTIAFLLWYDAIGPARRRPRRAVRGPDPGQRGDHDGRARHRPAGTGRPGGRRAGRGGRRARPAQPGRPP
ncbi:hypothetical protein LUX33_18680 [Actinomadura madurae]|uniref:hypothetical protein n=1 Tax=Actinomadura madurae TaxID=1993 RepID=UPI0020D2610E|nr:hypothetical protein [Actinomadura madurae]MCP9950239.1 hypothetical protein [Actinomadura madurae]